MGGRWIAAALAALALGATADAAHAASKGALPLTACRPDGVQEDLLCGVLTVPEDRARPEGRGLELKVVVIPARSATPLEPVFILSGGPGQAATDAAQWLVGGWERKDHDVVLLDLRGTGRETGLDCHVGEEAGAQAWVTPLFAGGAGWSACRDELSKRADLRLYTTPIAMDDVDDLRRALGHDRIYLEGGSSGTRAALVYLRKYGPYVKGAFLSGAAPFENRAPLYHAAAAQRAFDRVVEQCGAQPGCQARYPTFAQDLRTVLARLKAQPATVAIKDPATGTDASVRLTDAGFADGVRVMLYGVETGRRLPALLERAQQGDYAPFGQAAAASGANLRRSLKLGLLLSATCTEDLARIDPTEISAAVGDAFIGDHRVRGQMAACSIWPKADLPADYAAPFVSDAPALIISGDLDPVTPPKWGEALAGYFRHGRHVVAPGAHVANSACVGSMGEAFFRAGRLADVDVACVQADPLPPFPLE